MHHAVSAVPNFVFAEKTVGFACIDFFFSLESHIVYCS